MDVRRSINVPNNPKPRVVLSLRIAPRQLKRPHHDTEFVVDVRDCSRLDFLDSPRPWMISDSSPMRNWFCRIEYSAKTFQMCVKIHSHSYIKGSGLGGRISIQNNKETKLTTIEHLNLHGDIHALLLFSFNRGYHSDTYTSDNLVRFEGEGDYTTIVKDKQESSTYQFCNGSTLESCVHSSPGSSESVDWSERAHVRMRSGGCDRCEISWTKWDWWDGSALGGVSL